MESSSPRAMNQHLQNIWDFLGNRRLKRPPEQPAATTAETRYHVVFTGAFTGDQAAAVAVVAAAFKLGQENARRLLQTDRILKSSTNKMLADKIATELTRVGAVCRVDVEVPDSGEAGLVQRAAHALESLPVSAVHLPHPDRLSRNQRLLACAVACLLLLPLLWLALRPPMIGGDTAEEYAASIAAVAASAGPERATAVQKAITLLTAPAAEAQRESVTTDKDTAARLIYRAVAGKNARQILAEAESYLAQQRAAYTDGLAEADRKIAEAEQQLTTIAPANVPVVNKIRVEDAAFGWPISAEGPTLVFTLRNDSAEALMRVSLQGYLKDQTGKLLTSQPVSYAVMGGLAPGATAQVMLPTRHDSPWAKGEWRGRTDLQLSLRVANAENTQGTTLGIDYRPLENERQRHLDWKQKVQAELDQMKL